VIVSTFTCLSLIEYSVNVNLEEKHSRNTLEIVLTNKVGVIFVENCVTKNTVVVSCKLY